MEAIDRDGLQRPIAQTSVASVVLIVHCRGGTAYPNAAMPSVSRPMISFWICVVPS